MRDSSGTGGRGFAVLGWTAVAGAGLMALFCLLEWLVLGARLPVELSPSLLALVGRNVLLYAGTGLVAGVVLGLGLALITAVGRRLRPAGVWFVLLCGALAFYWVFAVNVLYPGGSRETAALVLDAVAVVAAALLLVLLLRRWGRASALVATVLTVAAVCALWLPAYLPAAGRGAERIDGGPDLGPVADEPASLLDLPDAPNILVIMLDTTRADCIGAYGSTRDVTPNIDRLAAESLVFEQAVTPEPLTRPAVSTMFTGLYPRTHGVDTNTKALAPEFVTLAEELDARGYATGAFTAASVLSRFYGTDQGFDSYTEPTERRWELSSLMAVKSLYVSLVARSRWSIEIPADEVTRRAVTWIGNNSDVPFFAYVHYFDPHYPYEPPPRHDLAAEAGLVGLPVPYDDPQDRFKPGFEMPEAFLRAQWLSYLGEIRYADENVGRLLASLDDMGLRDDTVVVLLSDHGESFEKGFYFAHGNRLFDSLVRVALMLRFPDRIEPGRTDVQVQLADLHPTLLSLAGAEPDTSLQGSDMFARAEGPDEPVYLQTDFGNTRPYSSRVSMGVRLPAWKYVDSSELGVVELFDLEEDPGELVDLSGERPDETREFAGLLQRWLVETEHRDAPAEELTPEREEALRALGYLQ